MIDPQAPPSMIAIDGPAASGKTTVGRLLAQRLGYLLVDTGGMYRAVTLAALQRGVAIGDEAAIVALAQQVAIELLPVENADDDRLCTVLLDGADVTWALRSADVDAHVSAVSAYQGVRAEMVRRQRALGQRGRVVMVGRDIGTVVLPDAPLKLYIVATAETRAERRWRERQLHGDDESYAAILADIRRRDTIDSTRKHSPLSAADDAVQIDTTARTPDEVVDAILQL